MPTYDQSEGFWSDWNKLSAGQQEQFQKARKKFVADLKAGKGFRAGLRVHRVQKVAGVYEITWAPDGRATFTFGDEVLPGERHIVWRRIGGHEILDEP